MHAGRFSCAIRGLLRMWPSSRRHGQLFQTPEHKDRDLGCLPFRPCLRRCHRMMSVQCRTKSWTPCKLRIGGNTPAFPCTKAHLQTQPVDPEMHQQWTRLAVELRKSARIAVATNVPSAVSLVWPAPAGHHRTVVSAATARVATWPAAPKRPIQ